VKTSLNFLPGGLHGSIFGSKILLPVYTNIHQRQTSMMSLQKYGTTPAGFGQKSCIVGSSVGKNSHTHGDPRQASTSEKLGLPNMPAISRPLPHTQPSVMK